MKDSNRKSDESTVGFTVFLSFLVAFALYVALLYLNLTPVFVLRGLFGPVGFYSGIIITVFSLHAVLSIIFAFGFHFSREQFRKITRVLLLADMLLPLSLVFLSISVFYIIETTNLFFLAVLLVLAFIGLLGIANRFLGNRISAWLSK